MRIHISEETKENIIKDYKENIPYKILCEKYFKLKKGTLNKRLNEWGVQLICD